MQRIFYLVQKEFRQIFREKANLIIIFVMPFIQLIILGFAITMDVKNISTVIVNQDQSSFSRQIETSLGASNLFSVHAPALTVKKALERMDNNECKTILIIPPHFERDVKSGDRPTLQILFDGVDGNSASIAAGYMMSMLTTVQIQWMSSSLLLMQNLRSLHRIQWEPVLLYNPEMESKLNIIPAIIALLLTMITLLLSAINIVREREIGTLEQLLVTPIRTFELIIGKVIPYLLLGLMLFTIGILAAGIIYGIWPIGSLFLLYSLSIIYMLNTLGLGIFFSTISSTQQQAMFMSWAFMIFAILLSGFFIPIENMPDIIQGITLFNPTRYFMVIMRAIYLKGSGIVPLLPELGAMMLFGCIIFIFSILRFHRRMT